METRTHLKVVLPLTLINSSNSPVTSEVVDLRNLISNCTVYARSLNTVGVGNVTLTYEGSPDGTNFFQITTTTGMTGNLNFNKTWQLDRAATSDLITPYLRVKTTLASGTSVDVEVILWYQEYVAPKLA